MGGEKHNSKKSSNGSSFGSLTSQGQVSWASGSKPKGMERGASPGRAKAQFLLAVLDVTSWEPVLS